MLSICVCYIFEKLVEEMNPNERFSFLKSSFSVKLEK